MKTGFFENKKNKSYSFTIPAITGTWKTSPLFALTAPMTLTTMSISPQTKIKQ